ncbi:hypothetical protein F8568_045485 [Actinomadura sp. LD22]|uniref:Uncharacterized protein n=1 Tax=Actinomadura physcomitrii TaxID=2650748 RepID=A0A6I4MU36_9ACTN|nr:hypothetical protein [Actinomadura physcomitrii]MWA07457.1 hypothetical protein [Actinomadura physcomitrii]
MVQHAQLRLDTGQRNYSTDPDRSARRTHLGLAGPADLDELALWSGPAAASA